MNIHPKVIAATGGVTVTGAVSTLIVYVFGLRGITIPADVALAGATIILALGAFVTGYFTSSHTGASS